MRLLSDIFERGKVDVVFSGHAHNYQRSFPLTFKAQERDGLPFANWNGTVSGTFTFDKEFDGKQNTHPKGTIYIVTGAGGAPLYKMESKLAGAQDFMDRVNSNTHSLTLCDIQGGKLDIKQVATDGHTIDEFEITK
jgi:hypothetical protein